MPSDIRNFFLYFSPSIVTLVAGLVTYSVYSKTLSAEHYGIIANLIVYFSILYALFSYGLSISGQKIIYVDKEEYRERLGNLVIFFVANFFFVVIIVFLFRNVINRFLFDNRAILYLLMLGPVQVFLSCIKNIPLEIFRSKKRAGSYACLTIAFTLLEPIVVLFYLLFAEITFSTIIDIKYIAFVAAAALFLVFAVKNVSLKFNLHDLTTNLKVGLPNVPALLSNWLVKGSDRIFLVRYYNLSTVGIYSANMKIERILTTLLMALNNTLFPDLVKDAKETNRSSTALKMALTLFPIFSLAVLFFGKEFIIIFSKKEYFQSSLIFVLIAISSYFFFIQHILWPFLMVESKINYAAMVKFSGAFFNVATNYYLIKNFGYIGAAWAILVSHIFIVLFLYWPLKDKVSFAPVMKNVLVLVLAAVFVLLFQAKTQSLSFVEIGLKTVAYGIAIFLLFFQNWINPLTYFGINKKQTGPQR